MAGPDPDIELDSKSESEPPRCPFYQPRISRRRAIGGGLAVALTGVGLYLIGGGGDDTESLSEQLDYDLGQVRRGAAVPRIFLPSLEDGLEGVFDIQRRKNLFIRLALPIVLAENEKIKNKAHRIPVSLALAQGAIESGWGTARFSIEGNAMFGERTYDPDAEDMVAEEGSPTFRVRAFADLNASVAAYMNNLNTHPEYAEFRAARAAIWSTGRAPSGLDLAVHLASYSEERHAYIDKIRRIITENRLGEFNSARLEIK